MGTAILNDPAPLIVFLLKQDQISLRTLAKVGIHL